MGYDNPTDENMNGTCLIQMSNQETAKAAANQLNNVKFGKNVLTVYQTQEYW